MQTEQTDTTAIDILKQYITPEGWLRAQVELEKAGWTKVPVRGHVRWISPEGAIYTQSSAFLALARQKIAAAATAVEE